MVGMRFFSKAKKMQGSLAIAFDADGACAARVARVAQGLPVVQLAARYAATTPRSVELLTRLHKDLHAGAYQCGTVLSAGEYQMLAVEAPAVPADELKTAMRWKLKDMLDFPVDQATIDVLAVPVEKSGGGRATTMFAVAARNSVIEARQTLFVDAGWPLSVIDIPEMAQRNFSAMLEAEQRGVAMLSFNADGGLLTVTFQGALYLSRRIDVTLEQLLDADHERKQVCFDKITLELQRSLDHFERQYSFISIARLVLAPSGAAGLDEYLSSNLYTRVETLDLASLLDLRDAPELAATDMQQRLFLALGAALRQEDAAA